MPTIESRVVEMRFDNKQFEDNAQQSMKTVDKLNKSLDFDKASKSIDKISESGKKFSLKGMEVALQTVTEKFSALEIAGMTAIANISDRLTNMGINFVKGFTTDLIGSGWDKYAQKTSAIQTIMSATAKDIQDEGERMKFVNEQIEKLNWFTDETSYSLLDMTNNIGKFTSNGIKLDDAATQMQGISVWASLSGASLSDASRAMYNLSQAMSSGQVKAIDWMSIENANMATREFKETAIQTAVEVGTLTKVGDQYFNAAGKAIEVTKDFRGTLADGWFNSDVLGKTLNKFGAFTDELYKFTDATDLSASQAIRMIDSYSGVGDEVFDMQTAMVETGLTADELTRYLTKLSSAEMDLGKRAFKAAQEAKTFQEAMEATSEAVASGWMQSFEYIFGDYLHAKKNWTAFAEELYELFAEPGNTRNSILKIWADEFSEDGGYGALMKSIGNAWQGIKTIGGTIRDAFDSIFDPFYNLANDGEKILARANWLTDFTKKIESFTEGFVNYFQEISEEAEEITKPIVETTETVVEVVDTIAKTQEVLDDLANQVIRGDYGNGQERIDTLRDLGYSYELVQNRVNELLGVDYRYEVETERVVEVNEDVAESASKTADAFRDQSITSEDSAKNLERTMSVCADSFRDFSDVSTFTTKQLTPAQKRLETLRAIFVDIFEVINWGKLIIEGILKVGAHATGLLIGALEGPFWSALSKITDVFEIIRENYDVSGSITGFFDDLIPVVDRAAEIFGKFFKTLSNQKGIIKLKGQLSNLVHMFGEIIGKIFGKLGDAAGKIDWALTLETVLDKLADVIGAVADKIADGIDYIVDHQAEIEAFASTIGQVAAGAFEALSGAIGDFIGSAKDFNPSDIGMFDFLDKINWTTMGNMAKGAKDIFDQLIEMIQNFDPNKLAKLAAGGGLAAFAYMVYNFFKKIGEGAKELSKIPSKLVGILDGLMGSIKGYSNEKNSTAVLKIAKAVGILAASLFALSFVDPENLQQVGTVLVSVMAMFAVIMGIIAKMKDASDDTLVDRLLSPVKTFLTNVQKTFKEAGNMAKFGVGLVALVAAIAMLGMLAKELSNIDWGTFLDGALKVTILGGLLVGAAVLLSKFAKKMNFEIGAGLLALSAGVWVLAQAIIPLSKIGITEMGVALLGLATIMAALTAVAVTVDGKSLIKFAAGALIFSAAMLVMVPSIMALSLIPFAKLAQGVGSIALLAIVLGAVGVVMAKVEGSGNELIKLSAALLILSAPMLAIGMNGEAAAMGLLLIAGALVALLAAGFIAQYIAVGLETLTASAIGIGIGAAAFGIGMLAIAAAIALVAKSLPQLTDGFVYMVQSVAEHGDELIAAITTILISLAYAVSNSAMPIAIAVVDVVLSVCNQLVAALPMITHHLFQLLVGIVTFLWSTAGFIVNSLIQILVVIINAFANGIRENSTIILGAIVNLVDAIFDVLIECIASVVSMIPGVGGMLADNIRDLKGLVVPAAQDTGGGVADAIKDSANVDGVGDTIQSDLDSELSSIDVSSGISGFVTNFATDFQSTIGNGEVSTGLGDSLTTVFDENIPTMSDGSADLSNEFINSLIEDFGVGESDVAIGMSDMLNGASEEAESTASDDGDSVAYNFNSGILNGVGKYMHLVTQAGTSAGSELNRSAKAALSIESPSKVAALIGKFFNMGIGKGVKDNLSYIDDGAEAGTSVLVDGMRSAISRVQNIIDSDLDVNPRITPVLDLSNVQNGMNSFNGMFGYRTMDLAIAGANITTRDMRLSAEMTGIKNDISDLSKSIDNLAEAQNNQTYEFVTNTNLDGRNIAKATARYNRKELALLDRNTNRKGGKL